MSTPGVFELASYKRGQIPIKSVQQELTDALENGDVVSLPSLDFPLSKEEAGLLDARILAQARSVNYTPATGKISGTCCIDQEKKRLTDLMSRFARTARELAGLLFPYYKDRLRLMRTSLWPAPMAGPATSWRKDDTLLRVDAYPAHPTGGDRILRVFCNVNPQDKPVVWRLGEPFEELARHYVSKIGQPFPGSAELKYVLRLTKTMRTEYDHIMLEMRDAMLADDAYQTRVEPKPAPFAPGTTWFCFTDLVSHGVLSGQHELVQTIYVPVDAMWDTKKSPLRILERLKGRDLD
jgi:3-deoxy-D-manno-oct-2-ulosonic acid (Kdo) hydroxylase